MDSRMRKFLALVLALALVATMAVGCSSDDADDEADDTTTEEPMSEVKAAMVTDVGGLGDKSFNDLAWAGLEQAEAELGVEIKALASGEIADYEPNIDQLGGAGYDVVFTVGFLMSDTTQKKAPEYPDTDFAGIDQFFDEPADNQVGLLFREHEGAYLAGVIAGLATLDTEIDDAINDSNTIAFIGGEDIPPVEKFEVGFTAGARSVNPDIEVISLYAGSFVDQAKGKELALAAIEQGADIVFAAAGLSGIGAVTACNEAGALFIGVDADQYETIEEAKPIILTSAIKRVDQVVYSVVKQVVDGEFEGGLAEFGLAEGGVGLAPYHEFEDKISMDIEDAVDAASAEVLDGTVVVPATRDEL